MKIQASEIVMVPVSSIKENKLNRNRHSIEQVERLVQIIKYQGFREPLIVSNRSGLLVSGHCRLMAAQKLKMESVPVIWQEFESDAQEYAHMIADNEIARWAELDMHNLLMDLNGLQLPSLDLLGLEDNHLLGNLALDPDAPVEPKKSKKNQKIVHICPECHHEFQS